VECRGVLVLVLVHVHVHVHVVAVVVVVVIIIQTFRFRFHLLPVTVAVQRWYMLNVYFQLVLGVYDYCTDLVPLYFDVK